MDSHRSFAVITGASSGIGYELAREFLEHGFDVLITSEDPGRISDAHRRLDALKKSAGAVIDSVAADLATTEGVRQLCERIDATGRPVDAIAINAGVGAGGDFARQTSLEDELRLIQLNVTSTVHLAKRIARDMVRRGSGRILFTSSVASFLPSPFEAVYGASKAFVQSFAESLRAELKDAGVTVTALLPGPTETRFFHRAGMDDTKVGRQKKDSPAKVAHQGFEALMAGEEKVLAGSIKNKLFGFAGRVLPERAKAAMHWRLSIPDSAPQKH